MIRVASDVARALAAAHAQGLLHRDLKPENILVGDNGVTRVLDFGIARAIETPADRPRLTQTGMVVGTPGYISPEQLEGGAGDARSDVFALGIVLYELVTGTNPFQGPTPASTAARILTFEPPAPSRVNPIFPAALDAIAARCLRKDPAARYASAAEALADLDRLAAALAAGEAGMPAAHQERTGSAARADTPARAWWRTHQRIVIAVVAVLAIGNWWTASWIGFRHLLVPLVLALAVADGTLRLHLLWAERQGLAVLPAQLARTRPWLRLIELVMGFAIAGPASLVLSSHQAVGITMVALGAGLIVTGWAIEPVTAHAAFSATDGE